MVTEDPSEVPKRSVRTMPYPSAYQPQQPSILDQPREAPPEIPKRSERTMPYPSAYQPQQPSVLDQPPEKTRFQKFREGISSAAQRIRTGYARIRESRPAQFIGRTGRAGYVSVQKRIIQPARGFAKETLAATKAGFQEGKAETKQAIISTVRGGAKTIATSPIIIGRSVKERAIQMRERIRAGIGRGGIPAWHGGLIQPVSQVGYRAGQPRSLFGTVMGREPASGKFRGAGRELRMQFRYGGMPAPSGMGRMPRVSIPHGIIKPYWSKKLKKLARTNIRRFGVDEGLARTRQIAQLAGWKMQ